jgi:hypothetical protein
MPSTLSTIASGFPVHGHGGDAQVCACPAGLSARRRARQAGRLGRSPASLDQLLDDGGSLVRGPGNVDHDAAGLLYEPPGENDAGRTRCSSRTRTSSSRSASTRATTMTRDDLGANHCHRCGNQAIIIDMNERL